MKKSFFIFTIIILVLVLRGGVSAEVFECAFIQDKYLSGRPNRASCSMYPETVYSDKRHTPKKSEHCQVETAYTFEDLVQVTVDLDKGVVRWLRHFAIQDEMKPSQKQYLMKEGLSEKEANKKVNFSKKQAESYVIRSHTTTQQKVYLDEVTGHLREQPKLAVGHTFIFSDEINLFHLYIPETSGHAILFEPKQDTDVSWVGMRFGKCRKLK